MRRSVAVALLALLATVGACRRDGLTEEQRRLRQAASEVVRSWAEGRYSDVVGGIAYAAEMSDDYRSQLADLLAEYQASELERRGGIARFDILDDTISDSEAQVFVRLCFADSTAETVAVPFVLSDGEWRLR